MPSTPLYLIFASAAFAPLQFFGKFCTYLEVTERHFKAAVDATEAAVKVNDKAARGDYLRLLCDRSMDAWQEEGQAAVGLSASEFQQCVLKYQMVRSFGSSRSECTPR